MIYLKKDVNLISDFINKNSFNSYWYEIIENSKDKENYSKDLYAIYDDNEIIGCVEVFIFSNDLYISMIEVADKNNHIGIKTIKLLFELYDEIETITGESLIEAIGFWYKIGASFDCDEEHLSLDELYELEMSLLFTLSKKDFLKYLKSEVI